MIRVWLSVFFCLKALCINNIVYRLSQTVSDASDSIQSIAIAHDGGQYMLASSLSGEVLVYKKENGWMQLTQTIRNKFQEVWSLDMTDDYWLAIGSTRYLGLYHLNQSSSQFELVQLLKDEGQNSYGVQMTNDHQHLLVGKENCSVLVFNWNDGKFVLGQTVFYPGSSGCRVYSMSLSKDNKFLVVGRVGNVVSVYKNSGGSWGLMLSLSFQLYDYRVVKISADHQIVVVGSQDSQLVSIYKNNGTALQIQQNIYIQDEVFSVDLSSDKTLLIVGCYKVLYVFENVSGTYTQIEQIQPPGYVDDIMAARLSYNKKELYIGSQYGSLHIYHQAQQNSQHSTEKHLQHRLVGSFIQ